MSFFNGPTVRFEPTTTDTPAGPLDTVGDVRAHWRSDIATDADMGGPMGRLRDVFQSGVSSLAARAPEMSSTGFINAAKHWAENTLAPVFEGAQRGVHEARKTHTAHLATVSDPAFGPARSPAVDAEQRQWARTAPLKDLLPAINSDPTLAAAIVAGGRAMSGLSPDIYDRIRDTMLRRNLRSWLGPQSEYRTLATADDPIAGHPDEAAIEQRVDEILAAHEVRGERIAAAPALLSAVVSAVAAMTDLPREDAFKLVAAR